MRKEDGRWKKEADSPLPNPMHLFCCIGMVGSRPPVLSRTAISLSSGGVSRSRRAARGGLVLSVHMRTHRKRTRGELEGVLGGKACNGAHP